MLYPEEDLIMLSALQHFVFCPRQCALIHIDQVWTESGLTAEGRILHERVHEAGDESRGGVHIARGVPLRSLRVGLVGIADVVEFHREDKHVWRPFPVEYKRGKPKPDLSDIMQLCGQAVCLEEMLNLSVPKGALFYGKTRRRHEVSFDQTLRAELESTVCRVRGLLESRRIPDPVYTKKCDNCSVQSECLPKAVGRHKSVKRYLSEVIKTQ